MSISETQKVALQKQAAMERQIKTGYRRMGEMSSKVDEQSSCMAESKAVAQARTIGMWSAWPNALPQDGHFLDRLAIRFCTQPWQKV